jgi:hypothetical protein
MQTGNSCKFLARKWTFRTLGGINVQYCIDYCIAEFCLIINSMMGDLSWERDSRSVTIESPRPLGDPNMHYRAHNTPPTGPYPEPAASSLHSN